MVFTFIILFSIPILYIVFSIVYKNGIAELYTNPVVLGSIFFFIIHLLLPLLQWENSYFRYSSSYDEQPYVISVFYVFLAQLLTIVVFRLKTSNIVTNNKFVNLSPQFLNKALRINFIVFILSSYFAYKNVVKILSMGFEKYMSDRISFGLSNGFEMLIVHWTYISCIIFYFIYLKSITYRSIRRNSLILFLISFSVTVLYYSLNSNRNSIFILLINLAAFHFIFSGKTYGRLTKTQLKKISRLVIGAILAGFLFYSLGKLREDTKQQDEAYTLIESLNGAFGNHENIVWLKSHDYEYLHGATYLAAITNFVPRSIWKDKPVGAGPHLKNAIYPGSYVVGEKGNSSLTTGFYNELQMNFGFAGVFGGAIIYAILMSILYSFFKNTRSPVVHIITIYTVVVFSTQFYYAEFLGLMSRYIFSLIPFLILLLFTKRNTGIRVLKDKKKLIA